MRMTQDIIENSLLQLRPKPLRDYDCIESCFELASYCWICVDACLNEKDHSHLSDCIKLSLKCAEVCATTSKMLIFQEEYSCDEIAAQVRHCRDLARLCLKEYGLHSGHHEHCLICAKCAQDCIRSCEDYLKRWEYSI